MALQPQRLPRGIGPMTPTNTPVNSFPGNPATGLRGSEQALSQGLRGGLTALGAGAERAIGDIGAVRRFGAAQLATPVSGGSSVRGIDDFGDFGQEAAMQALRQAQSRGAGQITSGFNQAAGGFDPFTDIGAVDAQERRAALSGAMGSEAQQAAIAAFNASPGQEFMQDRARQNLLRSASATGGLGGGRVLEELNRQGVGFGRQDFNDNFNRLGEISQFGLGATGQQAGIRAQGAQTLAGFNQALASQQANLAGQFGGIRAGLAGQLEGQRASQSNQRAALESQQRQLAAQLGIQSSRDLSNVVQGAAGQAANLAFGTGQQRAQDRLQTGRDIAGVAGQTSSDLAELARGQGAGAADIIGASGSNIANLIKSAGEAQGLSQEQLSAILANISTGTASTVAAQPGAPIVADTSLQDTAAILGATGNVLSAFDQPAATP